jgi:hypothetical protein
VLFGVVFCVSDEMYDPEGEPLGIVKGDFVYVVMFMDFVVIACTIWLINLLGFRYK